STRASFNLLSLSLSVFRHSNPLYGVLIGQLAPVVGQSPGRVDQQVAGRGARRPAGGDETATVRRTFDDLPGRTGVPETEEMHERAVLLGPEHRHGVERNPLLR